MAERKSGPVKPPIIDLTARDAGKPEAEKPANAPGGKPASSAKGAPAEADTPGPASDAPKTEAPRPADAPRPVAGASGQEKPDDKPDAGPAVGAGAAKPPHPDALAAGKPAAPSSTDGRRSGISWAPLLGAVLAGALLGTALTLTLARFGYFPPVTPDIPEAGSRLAATEQAVADVPEQLSGLEERIGILEGIADGIDGTLEQVQADLADTETARQADREALDAGLGDLTARIESLSEAGGGADLGSLQDDLAALGGRVDAIASGAQGSEAGLSETLETLQRSLSTLQRNATANETRITELETALDDANAALAEQAARAAEAETATPAAEQIVPALGALESAVMAGRPFATELNALATLAPDTEVPEALADAAPAGLVPAAELQARFAERLPAMLAAQPGAASGTWQDDFAGWARSLLALRPADELEGDSPDAVLSRLEGAMARADFVAASTLLAELPPPMLDAAGDLPEAVAAHADAQTLIGALRAEAAS